MPSTCPNKTAALLELDALRVNYGPALAVRQLHFTLHRAEAHAIVGERSAGKSSIGLVLSGRIKPASGRIDFDGQAFRALSITKAHQLGIEMIYQQTAFNEIWLNPHFTVAENFTLPCPRFFFWETRQQRQRRVQAIFERFQIPIDPATFVRDLSLSDQILLEILKRLLRAPKLLILDEALGRLSSFGWNKVRDLLRPLKQAGLAILILTSRIDDIYDFADRVSVMKNGEIVVTDEVKNIGKLNLIRLTYTQMSQDANADNFPQEFYQLLQYNEAILRHLPVNLIVTDSQARIKLVNESCKAHFGLEPSAYVNLPLDNLFPLDNTQVRGLLRQALLSQEAAAFYQVPIRIRASETLNTIKTFPIFDGALLIGCIITIEDVSEYDQLQKQLILSEKLASVGLLAAGVAHEINNPLEIIYNYLSYIKYNFHGKELHEAIDNVHEEISDIANIVSNLHTFSDRKKALAEDLDMHEVIASLLNLIQYSAKHRQIRIHFTPTPADVTIRANKNEIKQVLLNLLKNSFEAMSAGGDIEIAATPCLEHGAPVVQISFQDTGPGINDANPNNIFLPFYSTKKGAENNLGLGLSVSYGIIKKYNGTISVHNLEHGGCQFLITLPRIV